MGIHFGRGKIEALIGYEFETEKWNFSVGQCVTHISQPLPSIVLWRTRGGDNEVYGIRSVMAEDENRDRLMMGDRLRKSRRGSDDCATCLLRNTALCPAD